MENLDSILNKEQAEAVRCTEGPVLVLAGAGSGKTRVLTHRAAYLIENCGVDPWNILAITFTNKAAGEMRERIDRLVGVRAREIWVSTFHSMCVRILRRHIDLIGYTSDFSIYDTDDQLTLMKQVFKSLNIDPKLIRERAALGAISSAKNEGMDAEDFRKAAGSDLRQRRIADCFTEYQKRLHQNNALDFDDLLIKTVELFKTDDRVLGYYQNRFRYIMVDEYQDTNDIQFELVHLLAGQYHNICVVGDDDQSIYKFRGANLNNILNFEKFFPGAHVIKLEQNYRSTSRILDIANAVISHNTGRKPKKLWTEKKGGAEVVFHEFENANDEANAVISDVWKEVQNNGRAYHDMAVLYRTNAQSRLLEEQCIHRNVPYQIIGGVNFYQRKEIKDVLAYMKVIANGSDTIALERIINVPKRGIGASTIQKLHMFAEANSDAAHQMTLYEAACRADTIGIGGKAGRELKKFTEMIERYRDKLRGSGYLDQEADPKLEESFTIQDLIKSIRDDTGYGEELRAEGEIEAETRFENIDEIVSKAASYQAEAEKPKLSEFLEEVSLVADIDRADESKDTLTLMTLHGAKGLEFPKVYLVGMSDGLFPGYMSMNDPEDLEEERRLCYVGITRAEQELVMTSARSRMVNGEYQRMKPSRFIDEIPDQLITKELLYPSRVDIDGFSDFSGTPFDDGMDMGMRRNAGNREDDRFGRVIGGHTGTASGSYGVNSYGLRGMGSTGYLESKKPSGLRGRSGAGATGRRRSGSGIPGYMQKTSEQRLSSLDYGAGDRVRHVKFGEGTVVSVVDGKKDFEVVVDFDKAGRKKMFASFAKLRKLP